MKKLSILFVTILFIITGLFAQTPKMFKYQAVLRDASGNVIVSQAKSVVIDILRDSPTGTIVFTETHNVTTTAQGIINLNIGSVNTTGIATINWAANTYFIKIAVGGIEMGTSQLLSVPYALNSKNAENLSGTITKSQISDFGTYLTTENDPIFSAWNKSTGISISKSQISDLPSYLTSYTETDPIFGAWNKSTGISISKSQISDLPVNATTTVDGFMSNTDKTKLDGLANADGSETKLTAGTNVTLTGSGTTGSPYVINTVPNLTQVQRDALTPVEGLIVYNSTTKKPNYYNGTEWMNYDGVSAKTLAIGDAHQGGIIAYILQPGDPGYAAGQTHGLIAAAADQGTSNAWNNGTNTTTGATGTALGTGSANTTTIITNQGNTGTYAAKICRDYAGGGYNDWYLPSLDELNKLYLNRVSIGGFASNVLYWSSTEDNGTAANGVYFSGGGGVYLNGKGAVNFVRAVRTF